MLVNTELAIKFGAKIGGEAWITVRHNALGQAMLGENIPDENISKVLATDGSCGRDEVNHLGKAVHESDDSRVSAESFRELCDKIHRYAFPLSIGDGQGLKESRRSERGDLGTLANITMLNILSDLSMKARPPVVAQNKILSANFAQMSRVHRVMMQSNALNAQIPRIRDDDAGIPPPKLAIKDVFTSFQIITEKRIQSVGRGDPLCQ
jgi:hypothetical protein